MNFRSRHRAERGAELVLLPFSFGSDDHGLISEKFARSIIVFPIFRHKNFENRMRREPDSSRTGEAEEAPCHIRWNFFGRPSFLRDSSSERKIGCGWVFAVPKRDAVLNTANDFVFSGKKVGEDDAIVRTRGASK